MNCDSVDLRARPLEEAKHWADDRITNRAQFVTHGIASLMLANVSAADSAFYRCRVDFRHSPTRHFRYKLNVVSKCICIFFFEQNIGTSR